MSNALVSLLALVVTLGVLIAFHEFGHFWVARRLGVKVLRFSIGFGRPLWKYRGRVDDTEYAIAAIPLGGYVRMLDEREAEVPVEERHRAFNRQPVGTRIGIVVAGPLFNFLFAILAYSLMFMIGVSGIKPLIGEVAPDSIAAEAGFQRGDLIVAVEDQLTPTLNEAMLALLEGSMDEEVIEVKVRNEEGQTVTRYLDLSEAQRLSAEGRLLANLGLFPWHLRLPPVIEQVQSGGSADRAGLQSEDRILAVDGKSVKSWQQWASYVQENPDQTIDVRIERNGRELTLQVVPEAVETDQGTIGRIGAYGKVPEDVSEDLRVVVSYGPFEAITQGVTKTWDMSLLTLRMLGRMLIGKASLENISGPITIAQFAGQSASVGIIPFLSFLALVSVSLGVLNLLPIPILDGGHLLYYLIELIKGSPLSESAQNLGQRIGIIILLMLMSLALFNDLVRLLG